ncbi:MAG: DUF481 domain-containing protein [Thermoanaerobaculia bacterium]|nr:DUF481 domain-containing protein [Thermoanaerobaculia bacterium]
MTRFPSMILALACGLALPAIALGQEEESRTTGWSGKADLSLVATAGNKEARTVSMRISSKREWDAAALTLEAGGLRAEDTDTTRLAVGTASAFRVEERSTTEVTAESYFVRGRYRHDWSERMFWFAGAGWSRNEFNGVRNRYLGEGGVGTLWLDTERSTLRTDYGLTVTREESVVGDPAGGDAETFLGARLSYDYERQLTATAGWASRLILDQNLDRTADRRAELANSVSVAISELLALKVGLEVLYDAEPALELVPLVTPGGGDGGAVRLPLDEIDSILTVALVVDF